MGFDRIKVLPRLGQRVDAPGFSRASLYRAPPLRHCPLVKLYFVEVTHVAELPRGNSIE